MTDLEWQQRAAREVGSSSQNAVYQLPLPFGVTGGTFPVSVSGDSTSPLSYNVSAEAMQTALCLLPSIGADGAKVSGLRKGPYTIEITGDNAGQTVPPGWLLADGSALQPPATLAPVLLQNGAVTSLQSDAAKAWDNYPDEMPAYERFLRVKDELLTSQLAHYSGLVDQVDGDAQSKDSQRFTQLLQLSRANKGELAQLIGDRANGGNAQTYAIEPALKTRILSDFARGY